MLIENQWIETSVNNYTLEWYNKKGYNCNYGNKIKVKVEDLYIGSNQSVKVKCDFCGKIIDKQYKNYLKELDNLTNKISCQKCTPKRLLEEAEILNKQGKLTIENRFFYSFHKNRLNGVKEYIDKYQEISSLFSKDDGKRLMNAVTKNKEFIEDLLEELGYNYEEISELRKTCTPSYFKINGLEKIIKRVKWFVNKYNKFPSLFDCQDLLKINGKAIQQYGGINQLKKEINYIDENELIDLRGDYNRSVYETIVANYLYSQGLKDNYLREQIIFPKENKKYRSDFMFIPDSTTEKIIHVEVWGYENNKKTKINKEYNETKNNKKTLYNKYKNEIELISIEYDVFNKNYKEIEKELYKIFSPYLELKYKTINYELLFPISKLTNDELLGNTLKYSNNNETLPLTKDIPSSLYFEILKRFQGKYENFAKHFNKKLSYNVESWNFELMIKYFETINNENNYIDCNSMIDKNSTLINFVSENGGLIQNKLIFFNKYYKKNFIIKEELDWFQNVYCKMNINSSFVITEEQRELAYILFYKFYKKNDEIKMCKRCGRIIDSSIELFCENCKQESKNLYKYTSQYQKLKYNELEYENNFINILKSNESYVLTSKGFNENSKINTKEYISYFKLKDWIEVLKKFNKYDELLNYIEEEFIKFNKTFKNNSISIFGKNNKYIKYELLNKLPNEFLLKVGIERKNQKISILELKEELESVIKKIGHIPFNNEFKDNGSISISTYKKTLMVDSWEDVLIKLLNKEQIKDFLKLKGIKKLQKTEKAKERMIGKNKHSEEFLKENFIKIFNSFYKEHNKYPTLNEFKKLSNIDESTYRNRLQLKWSEIKTYYGFIEGVS